MSDLNLLLQKLTVAGFEFVLVGAFAAVVHGVTIVTRDLDVCAPFTRDNLFVLRARSVEIDFSWGKVHVLDIDALIEAKAALNRLQDKLAIPQRRAIRERRTGKTS